MADGAVKSNREFGFEVRGCRRFFSWRGKTSTVWGKWSCDLRKNEAQRNIRDGVGIKVGLLENFADRDIRSRREVEVVCLMTRMVLATTVGPHNSSEDHNTSKPVDVRCFVNRSCGRTSRQCSRNLSLQAFDKVLQLVARSRRRKSQEARGEPRENSKG